MNQAFCKLVGGKMADLRDTWYQGDRHITYWKLATKGLGYDTLRFGVLKLKPGG